MCTHIDCSGNVKKEMTLCEICNTNEANQTGAHIFPAWMIASAFDEKGRNRDYEVIHAIRSLDNELPYFGRSIQPEKIEESIGRELTEDEAESQKNFLVIDNLWCRKCENKLKILEDYFLENVDRNIIDFSNQKGLDVKTIKANIFLIRLFIYSLIYRASITKLMGFKLEEKIERKLKSFLNKYIQENLPETIEFIERNTEKNELTDYPVRCLKMETEKGKTFVHIQKTYDKPYCFIINSYIFQFYQKERHIRSTPYSFFGITDFLSQMKYYPNFKESEFQIGMMNLEHWNVVKSKFIKHHSQNKIQNFKLIYEEMFQDKFGYKPNQFQTQKFLEILVDNNKRLGVKYTKEQILDAMNKSIMK